MNSTRQLTPDMAGRLAHLALVGIPREYPNKIAHVLCADADAQPPHVLTPAFYGCFDWHSAVHGHWSLCRLLRFFPDEPWSADARKLLNQNLTEEKIAGEVAYLSPPEREGFERPYGLAWLLQLAAELREWNDDEARRWLTALQPLEQLAAEQFSRWLPKLSFPIRSGEHSQSAFAMALALDWSRTAGEKTVEQLLVDSAMDFHQQDRAYPWEYEPSGHDFFSPGLAAADLMRRVLPSREFAAWLDSYLRTPSKSGGTIPMQPVLPDISGDGKLAHLDGLNLSRAWMLHGMAAGLPPDDPRGTSLMQLARQHQTAGLQSINHDDYAKTHWLGSFAVYLLTARGMKGS